jgi:iron complex outermembrane receptor protein
MSALSRVFFALLCTAVCSLSLHAQTGSASISGTVKNAAGAPVSAADVKIVGLRRATTTSTAGAWSFDNVPAGRHVLQVTSTRFGSSVREVTTASTPVTIDFVLDTGIHAEEIVVTASADPRAASQVYQPVDVVSGQELQTQQRATLGETLAEQPGVSSTGFVPGASRPVIRGLGGDRIRILEDGIGTGDASNVSQDHNVSLDPANAQSIEIVRGAATLLYGSNAVGGVVNVIDDRIPTTSAGEAISGNAELRGGTAGRERAGAVSLEGDREAFAWHADFSKRGSGDVRTPIGKLLNSDVDTKSGAVGVSWVAPAGYLGIGYSGYDTNYGVSDAGPDVEPEEVVRIDMSQRRWDLKGELAPEIGPFNRLRLRVGKTDYEHSEVPDGVVAVTFLNDYTEGRVEASHRALGAFTGSMGAQYSKRDFSVTGEEKLLPPTSTKNTAIFLFEEATRGPWQFQFGGRYEQQKVDVADEELPDRDFKGLSGSFGLVWAPTSTASIALTASHSARLPVAEELYFDGAHEATFQFEVGNPNLDRETSNGLDLSLRGHGERVSGEVSVFATRFDGYIFQNPTGDEEDGFPVFEFAQAGASFHGAEAHTDITLLHRDPNHLSLELSADYVHAELSDSGEPLPFIPPLRFGVGLRYQGEALHSTVEVRRAASQNRVAGFETETDGFTLLNASVGYRLFSGNTVHDILLRGTNLTDELARNHLNPLKDAVPLPGRDLGLSYRVTF